MSVTNIFLFRDIVKVKIGIGEPSGIDSPTDGQTVVEGNITYTYDLSSTNWDISVQTNQIYVNGLTTTPTMPQESTLHLDKVSTLRPNPITQL